MPREVKNIPLTGIKDVRFQKAVDNKNHPALWRGGFLLLGQFPSWMKVRPS